MQAILCAFLTVIMKSFQKWILRPKYMIMPRAYSQAMADSALSRFDPEVGTYIDSKFYTTEVTSPDSEAKASWSVDQCTGVGQ